MALVVGERRRRLIAAGLVFALLVLTVPSFAPLVLVALLWRWHLDRRGVSRAAFELFAAAATLGEVARSRCHRAMAVLSRPLLAKRHALRAVELLLLAMVVNALFAAIFFTRVRLRLPSDLLVLIPIGGLVELAMRNEGTEAAQAAAPKAE